MAALGVSSAQPARLGDVHQASGTEGSPREEPARLERPPGPQAQRLGADGASDPSAQGRGEVLVRGARREDPTRRESAPGRLVPGLRREALKLGPNQSNLESRCASELA